MEVSFCIFEWPEGSSTYQQVGLGVQGAARVRWNAPNRCLCGTGATSLYWSVVFATLSGQYPACTSRWAWGSRVLLLLDGSLL